MATDELPLLDRRTEHALAVRYARTHDRTLEDRLVRSQLRLVKKLAHDYAIDENERAELVQEGSLGLVMAVRRFDPKRGVKLSTYAAWWIRAYQLRWLMVNHRMVRVGTTAAQRKVFFRLRATRRRLEHAGVEVTDARLARAIGVDARELGETALRMDAREVSLDQAAPGDDEARLDRLSGPEPAADERLAAEELAALIGREARKFLSRLGPRDRALFTARWLLRDGERQPTLKAVGGKLGVSRERARQLESRLLRQLRQQLPADVAAVA